MRSFIWLVTFAAICSIAGCSGKDRLELPATGSRPEQAIPAQMAGQLPPISELRQTDGMFTTELIGALTNSQSANAIVNGTGLDLLSGTSDYSWGIWQLSDLNSLVSVQAVVDVDDGEEFYLALADFSKGVWEFDGPLSAGKSLPLDENRHRSAAGNVFIAAITWAGYKATVQKFVLTTAGEWRIQKVGGFDDWAQRPRLLEVAGHPAICYFDDHNDQLRYERSIDANGESWNYPLAISNVAALGDQLDMAIVTGRPAICFTDIYASEVVADKLYYVIALDETGSSWDTPVTLHSGLEMRYKAISLKVVEFRPAVSFIRSNVTDVYYLCYARANDVAGNSWNAPQELLNTNDYLYYTSLVVDEGIPIISFGNYKLGQIQSIGAADSTGSSWNPPGIIAAGLGEWKYSFPSGAQVNSGLAVAYYNQIEEALKFARYSNPAAEWEHYSVDQVSAEAPYRECSLAVVDGKPAICYYDESSFQLKYVQATNVQGTSWGEPMVVYDKGGIGMQCSLADINSQPAISFVSGNQQLNYAYYVGP